MSIFNQVTIKRKYRKQRNYCRFSFVYSRVSLDLKTTTTKIIKKNDPIYATSWSNMVSEKIVHLKIGAKCLVEKLFAGSKSTHRNEIARKSKVNRPFMCKKNNYVYSAVRFFLGGKLETENRYFFLPMQIVRTRTSCTSTTSVWNMAVYY